jgi:hypothetical protein
VKTKLTNEDFCRAAKRLRCDVSAIKAVAQVESRGEPFYSDGFPIILFERHKFRKFTNGKFDKSHPRLSNKKPGGYGKAGQNQRNKFNQAFALDPEAAMMSCSWGMFQIMGFNHDVCGYETVGEFVDAMKAGVDKQLDAFVSFVIGNNLARHLRSKNFFLFAEAYNGPDQEKNNYDGRMTAAEKRFAKDNIDCSKVSAAVSSGSDETAIPPAGSGAEEERPPTTQPVDPPPVVAPQDEIKKIEPTEDGGVVEVTTRNEQDVNVPAKVEGVKPYNGIGFWPTIKRDLAAATGGNLTFTGLAEYAQQASGWPEWVVSIITKVAIGLLIATAGYLLFRVIHFIVDRIQQNHWFKVRTLVATDVNRKDLEVVGG